MFATPRARTLLRLAAGATALATLALIGGNAYILRHSRDRVFAATKRLPENDLGLVLGTSPKLGKEPNRFFEGRMDAAAKLYHAGKVRRLLLSGDNGTRGYDEPTAMKKALLNRGVPESALHLDYAGFRTLDSMARAQAVFGVKEVTVITDDFHMARSLFLADSFGLKAVGYSPAPVPLGYSKKTRAREAIARVASLVDVYVLHRRPKFYGPKVDLRLAADER
ncbi:MAG TPA: ElyC/SanA/YdcF family protein [Chthoniobacteraceae bacterium]|nr:ElyC/SanA/YdcF family protein [Chthoniobacteraceae bacterium]